MLGEGRRVSADRGLGWRERVGTRGWRTHLRESGGEVANRGRRQGILGTWGILRSLTELEEFRVGDFPGGPVVKSPRFHCRGRGLDH